MNLLALLLIFNVTLDSDTLPSNKVKINPLNDVVNFKSHSERPRVLYFNLGSGINSNFGVFGFGLEAVAFKRIGIHAEYSPITSWGHKFTFGSNIYLKNAASGFCINLAASYSTGLNIGKSYLQVVEKNPTNPQNPITQVVITPLPALSTSISIAYILKLNKSQRFKIETGISYQITDPDNLVSYDKARFQPTKNSLTYFSVLAPGGKLENDIDMFLLMFIYSIGIK